MEHTRVRRSERFTLAEVDEVMIPKVDLVSRSIQSGEPIRVRRSTMGDEAMCEVNRRIDAMERANDRRHAELLQKLDELRGLVAS